MKREIKNCVFLANEDKLTSLGFRCTETLDKDGLNDPFYTLKFRTWKKPVDRNCCIEISFGFKANTEANYKHIETTCELSMRAEYMKLNCKSLSDILALYSLLKGKPINCNCTHEETTGWTTVKCCNICGKPIMGEWCS